MKKATELENWKAVNDALKELGSTIGSLAKNAADEQARIDNIKATFEKKNAPLLDRRNDLRASIAGFVESHRGEFLKNRTKKLIFGKISIKTSTSIEVPDPDATIAALLTLKIPGLLKVQYSIIKAALKKLSDNTLAKIGAARITQDNITIEPDLETIRAAIEGGK